MIAEQLSDLDMGITTSFYRTSIYDNSIFDGVSKSTPNESSLYELCSDSIDVVLELVGIYSRSDGAATTALTSSDSLKLEDEVGRELKEPTVASIM